MNSSVDLVCGRRSEEDLQELVVSVKHVGLRDGSLVLRVRSSLLYLPIHLTGLHQKIFFLNCQVGHGGT